jgi:hypothetical protein
MPPKSIDRKTAAATAASLLLLRAMRVVLQPIFRDSKIPSTKRVKSALQKKTTPYPKNINKRIARDPGFQERAAVILADIKDPESKEGSVELRGRLSEIVNTPGEFETLYGNLNPYTSRVIEFLQGETPDPQQRDIGEFFESKERPGQRPQDEVVTMRRSVPSMRQQTIGELKEREEKEREEKEREEKVPETEAQKASQIMTPAERKRMIASLTSVTSLTGIPLNIGGYKRTIPFRTLSNANLLTLVTSNSRLFNNPMVQRVISGIPEIFDAKFALQEELKTARRDLIKKAVVSTLSEGKHSQSMSRLLTTGEAADFKSGVPFDSKRLDLLIDQAEEDPVVYQNLIENLLNDPVASETFRKIDKKEYPEEIAITAVSDRVNAILASGLAGGVGALSGGAGVLGGLVGAGAGALGGALLDRTSIRESTSPIVPPLVGAAIGASIGRVTQTGSAGKVKDAVEDKIDAGLKATGQTPLIKKTPVVLPTQTNTQQENNVKKQWKPRVIAPTSEILEPTKEEAIYDEYAFTAFDYVKSNDWGNGAPNQNILMKAQQVSNELVHLDWRRDVLRKELEYLKTKKPVQAELRPAPFDSFNPSQFEDMIFIPEQPLGFESPYRFFSDVDGTNMEIKRSMLYGVIPG